MKGIFLQFIIFSYNELVLDILTFSYMDAFLSQNSENNRLELKVDTTLFSPQVVMKAAYTFLDQAYFFFRKDDEGIIVQITPKESASWTAEKFALEYSDELLATLLRYNLERDNKEIRETIVKRALSSFADVENFTYVARDEQVQKNQIDFDKDIDDILKEIENDPDLKIDESEITRILAEIESETSHKNSSPKIDLNKLKDAKTKFQTR